MLDDRRLVKMILESAQMLSTAMHVAGVPGPYRKTHENHPCSVWVRQSSGNFHWLLKLMNMQCSEYTRRFGRIHKCEALLAVFAFYLPNLVQPMTPFVNCTTNHKHVPDVFEAYRREMRLKWTNDGDRARWHRRKRCR